MLKVEQEGMRARGKLQYKYQLHHKTFVTWALRVQVLVQSNFLDMTKRLKNSLQNKNLAMFWDDILLWFWTYLWVLDRVLHDLLPVAVDGLEEPSLLGHLLHDVLRAEDGLQVEPLGLHLQPLINRLLHMEQTLLPNLEHRWQQVKKYL